MDLKSCWCRTSRPKLAFHILHKVVLVATLHNVRIGQYDSPVQIIPLYNIQGKRPKFCFGGQFSLSRTLILHDMVSISCFHIFLGH